jgi:hypothetical protein
LEVLGEYLEFKKKDPSFDPARPVLPCAVRPPISGPSAPLVTDPSTARVLDAFNVTYEVILYAIARYFGHGDESETQFQVLADVAVGLMVRVLKPLGELATTLPVGDDYPGMTAGPSFDLIYGSGYLLPHRTAAWTLMEERLGEVVTFMRRREDVPDEIEAAVDGFISKLAEHRT